MRNMFVPPAVDQEGLFIPTMNKTGYALSHLDSVSKEFIEYIGHPGSRALEIGAAYGLVSLEAAKRGVDIYCNDVEPKHLASVQKQMEEHNVNIKTVLGSFPESLSFPENFFDAILVSRVIHFFTGEVVELAIKKMFQWLKPGGKVFIAVDSPYLKILESFIPEYEMRVKRRERWPGIVTGSSEYLNIPQGELPSFIHAIDLPVLLRVLIDNHFRVEKIDYADRQDYPKDRRLDGRESVVAIAQKPRLL